MKHLFLVLFTIATFASAAVPDPVIGVLSQASSYVTIAGHLSEKPNGPVGISIKNGGIIYPTVSDPDGNWGAVVRMLTTHFEVASWSLTNANDRGQSQTVSVPAK